jgi:hypothetical protein
VGGVIDNDIVNNIILDAQSMIENLMIKDSFHNSKKFWEIYYKYYLLEIPVSIFSGILSSARKRLFSHEPGGSIYACIPDPIGYPLHIKMGHTKRIDPCVRMNELACGSSTYVDKIAHAHGDRSYERALQKYFKKYKVLNIASKETFTPPLCEVIDYFKKIKGHVILKKGNYDLEN